MSEVKNIPITIKFSESEYQSLQNQASVNGLPLATYARERILFDVPQIEHQSFEFKVLKALSYCVGMLSTVGNSKLSEEEITEVDEEAARIMKANGLDLDMIKLQTK